MPATGYATEKKHVEAFAQQGYTVVEGLFTPDEVERYIQHYTDLRQSGTYPGDTVAAVPKEGDPLKRWPRMIHMHRWDEVSRDFMIDPRVRDVLTAVLGAEPLAVQTMLYFKPPGARGQALHQDNFYLRAKPGTCAAAWLALDDCDDANGCLRVVPGSHTWDLICPTKADANESFTDVTVPLPPETEAVPVTMKAGDVMFFNGQLVHGSLPNTTADRFRRSLIGHYIEGRAEEVGSWYSPIVRFDGSEFTLRDSEGGGPCGRWVDREGQPVLEVDSQWEFQEKGSPLVTTGP